ncbi:DNA replication factor Cdt1-like [Halichondria panicea]|uniref:DNA replication factor Cdt1-like n=1 Tax=Halichondria panicea TaxID=6063 RepID=UPI00312B6556
MAQSSISGYFPSKKRRTTEDHAASIKRRKLSLVEDSTTTTSQPVGKATTSTATSVSKATSSSSRTRRAGTRRSKTSHAKGQRSLQDLFDVIAEAAKSDIPAPGEQADSSKVTTPPPSDVTPSLQLSPCPDTMTKLSALKSHLPTPRGATLPSTPPKRPPTHPPRPPTSRGAALVQLAQLKSPVKNTSHTPHTSQSRREMVAEMHRLSAHELALPTREEKQRAPAINAIKERAPAIKEFRCLEIQSPTKETGRSKVPAYKRLQSLAEPVPLTSDLPLPPSYALLAERFRCTDTVVNMLHKRQEMATFNKLKKAVQKMSRRDFEVRNLAQIKTVHPTAFKFRQEKSIPGCYDTGYQLTLECVTDVSSEALKPADLIKRRKVFHDGLVSVVREHHKTFLLSLDPPLSIPEDKVQRWHPDFNLDSLPEVVESPLPQPPLQESYTGAADVLREVGSRLTPRVTSALSDACQGVVQEATTPLSIATPLALKGISPDLLDMIRAKEATKARATITRDPVKERRLEMVARLPEFVRILRCLFVVEKKASLCWEDVVSKVSDSTLSRMAPERVADHLHCLSELAPDWLTLVTVKKRRYVKLNKRVDVKATLEVIAQAENNLKQ